MPVIDTTTTNNDLGSSSGSSGGDVGSGGTTINSNGSTTINSGSAAGNNNYLYEIVGLHTGIGGAYLATNSSNLSCNSSVAVMNRNSAFICSNTSTANLSNCASYVAQSGFKAIGTSRLFAQMSMSSMATYNYIANTSSSINTNTSMSVFPLNIGQAAYGSSSIANVEYESMTSYWGNNSGGAGDGPVPTHFLSTNNSYIENRCNPLSQKISVVRTFVPGPPTSSYIQPGLSGPIVEGRNLKFLWSQIYNPNGGPGLNLLSPNNIFFSQAKASYRFVPFSQSLDYGNIVSFSTIQANFISAGEDTTRGLISLLAMGRNCYTQVKPPAEMYLPEDKSGNRYSNGLTGPYTMSDLLGNL